ncbi:carbohydrate-binding domain-containing protein [Muricoccus vinaceus]|uniref:Carbohydrate-binding domain-containing protein n=1 Tax=Muricoccus vinaceus TaxID=424704 RepID=A0ABV6J033_9PROT
MQQIGTGKTELEDLSLSGFTLETHGRASAGEWVKTAGSGQASASFNGVAGTYTLSVGYMDENDGSAPMSVSVNGRVVKSWVASANNDQNQVQSVTVALAQGDTISVGGSANWGEAARMDWVNISPAGAAPVTPPAPAPTPAPAPVSSAGKIGLGVTELDTLSLSGFTVEAHGRASSGEWVKTAGNGSATGKFEGTSGAYKLTVGYMDENDGSAPMSVSVNGRVVKSWVASANNDQNQTQSVNLSLNAGDTISVNGTAHWGEAARMDWLKVEAAGTAAPAPAPAPTPAAPPPVVSAPSTGGSTAVPDSAFDLFAFAGQSNSTGHFFVRQGDKSGGPLGESVFESAVSKALGGPVDAISVGVSGSGSNQYADGNLFWWDINANKPSGLLVNAVNQIQRAESGGKQLDGLVWAQGEDDARQAYGSQKDITVARLTESTEKTFAYIRGQLGDPDLPIFLQELGTFPNDVPTAQYDAIRAAQAQIVAKDPNTFLGASTTDLNRHNADNVHYSNAEYGVIAGRLASSVSQVITAQNGGGKAGAADTIVLRVSEDAWQGDARFTVKVDGAQVGGTYTTTASHAAGQTQDIVLSGNWSDGRHKLSVEFLNDGWGGTASTDRNLYVEDIWANGAAQSNDQAALMHNGTASFDVIIA